MKDNVDGYGAQMLEKAVLSTTGRNGCLPGEACELRCGVESEGKEIKSNEETGQGAFAVTKIVF